MIRFILCLCFIVSITSCEKVEPNNEYKDKSFILSVSDTSNVLANEKAYIKLMIRKTIPTDRQLKVTFTSKPGTLTASDVYFSGDSATTYLQLTSESETFYINAKIYDNTTLITEKSITYTSIPELNINNSYSFSVADTAGAKANGEDLIKLVLKQEKYVQGDIKISFSTNKGELRGTPTIFENNQAITYLVLDNIPGMYYLTASIMKDQTLIAEKKITYISVPAYPAALLLGADTKFFNLTDPITINTILYSANNKLVSTNIPVYFNAYQQGFSDVGHFKNALDVRSNSDGKVTDIEFNPDIQMDSTEALYITATTVDLNGMKISDTVQFNYRR